MTKQYEYKSSKRKQGHKNVQTYTQY